MSRASAAAGEIKTAPFSRARSAFLAGRLMGMTEAMINCYEDPETAHLLLRKASYIGAYIQAFKAGAGGVVMAGRRRVFKPVICREFSSDYIKEIFEKLAIMIL